MDIMHILLGLVVAVCIIIIYVAVKNVNDEKNKAIKLMGEVNDYRHREVILNNNVNVLTTEVQELNEINADAGDQLKRVNKELDRVNNDFDKWSETQARHNQEAERKLSSQVAHYGKLKKSKQVMANDLNVVTQKYNDLSSKLACGFSTSYFSHLGSYYHIVECKAPSVKEKAKNAILDFTNKQNK